MMHSSQNQYQHFDNAKQAQRKAISSQSDMQNVNLDNYAASKDKAAKKTTTKFVAGFGNS